MLGGSRKRPDTLELEVLGARHVESSDDDECTATRVLNKNYQPPKPKQQQTTKQQQPQKLQQKQKHQLPQTQQQAQQAAKPPTTTSQPAKVTTKLVNTQSISDVEATLAPLQRTEQRQQSQSAQLQPPKEPTSTQQTRRRWYQIRSKPRHAPATKFAATSNVAATSVPTTTITTSNSTSVTINTSSSTSSNSQKPSTTHSSNTASSTAATAPSTATLAKPETSAIANSSTTIAAPLPTSLTIPDVAAVLPRQDSKKRRSKTQTENLYSLATVTPTGEVQLQQRSEPNVTNVNVNDAATSYWTSPTTSSSLTKDTEATLKAEEAAAAVSHSRGFRERTTPEQMLLTSQLAAAEDVVDGAMPPPEAGGLRTTLTSVLGKCAFWKHSNCRRRRRHSCSNRSSNGSAADASADNGSLDAHKSLNASSDFEQFSTATTNGGGGGGGAGAGTNNGGRTGGASGGSSIFASAKDHSIRRISQIRRRRSSYYFSDNERRIRANDREFNAQFKYTDNYIKTSKYTLLTFMPFNLLEQFQRLANFYFLCLLVLQLIPAISSLTPVTTAIPLIGVLTLTAVKDAYDDIQRHLSDSQVNNRRSKTLRNGKLIDAKWSGVQVGDVIRLENNQFVAADILLLTTSEPNGLCFIETAELDGETNLKCKQCVPETTELGQQHDLLWNFNGEIICERPNNLLNKFEGTLIWRNQRFALDNEKILLRGCVLRNTQWCYGVVIFAGKDTKLMQNSGKTQFKSTGVDRLLNFIIIGIVLFLLSICAFFTLACAIWEGLIGQHFQVYLPWENIIPKNVAQGATVIGLLVFFSYAIVLNTVVPISLYVSVEVIRFAQSFLINWDEEMCYEKTKTHAKARTTTLNEELGQIQYIFSDKTGTLTQNIMTFNKCSINGRSYGDVIDLRTGEVIEISDKQKYVQCSNIKLSGSNNSNSSKCAPAPTILLHTAEVHPKSTILVSTLKDGGGAADATIAPTGLTANDTITAATTSAAAVFATKATPPLSTPTTDDVAMTERISGGSYTPSERHVRYRDEDSSPLSWRPRSESTSPPRFLRRQLSLLSETSDKVMILGDLPSPPKALIVTNINANSNSNNHKIITTTSTITTNVTNAATVINISNTYGTPTSASATASSLTPTPAPAIGAHTHTYSTSTSSTIIITDPPALTNAASVTTPTTPTTPAASASASRYFAVACALTTPPQQQEEYSLATTNATANKVKHKISKKSVQSENTEKCEKIVKSSKTRLHAKKTCTKASLNVACCTCNGEQCRKAKPKTKSKLKLKSKSKVKLKLKCSCNDCHNNTNATTNTTCTCTCTNTTTTTFTDTSFNTNIYATNWSSSHHHKVHALESVDFSDNPEYEPEFRWYDRTLLDAVRSDEEHAHNFFRLLALCHTVMPEYVEGRLEYQAQSPDEEALVSAARNFGFVFRSRTPNSITIEVMGRREEYELLNILDFNNVRKRMSVILRRGDNIVLYCKGADNVIYDRLGSSQNDMKARTQEHLNKFAGEGLRTLVLAERRLNEDYFENWRLRQQEASISMDGREDKLSAIYEEIESELTLVGVTAIEDKLQDGVPQTIANLQMAGIKIWVLTGDKQETAINIGYSCQLLTDELADVFIVDGSSLEEVEKQLRQFRESVRIVNRFRPTPLEPNVNLNLNGASGMDRHNSSVLHSSAFRAQVSPPPPPAISVVTFRWDDDKIKHNKGEPDSAECNELYDSLEKGAEGATTLHADEIIEESTGFAIVVNGHSLVYCLSPELEAKFLDIASQCKAVICCRVTPLQKALVVELIKRAKNAVTLAIGDGANDVSMIKAAHIGVGISGQEGLQAVLASDYSIAQFRYLERLLLVHGRWSYYRMCKFLRYFFYKNFAFTLCHCWYSFFCGFSAQTVFDPMFISVYNLFYTSLPVLALGVFEQDVSDKHSVEFPKLYTPGLKSQLFNTREFVYSVLHGAFSSLILFLIPYGTYKDGLSPDGFILSDHMTLGAVVATILIVDNTAQIALYTSYWSIVNHITIWGSLVTYIVLDYFYNYVFGGPYVGSLAMAMKDLTFWVTMLITVIMIMAPVLAYKFYLIDVHPSLGDKIRMKRRQASIRSRQSNVVMRTPSARKARRSLRSGYAFAHQEGFGRLITSGKIMRKLPQEFAFPLGLGSKKLQPQTSEGSDGKNNQNNNNSTKNNKNSSTGYLNETDANTAAAGGSSEDNASPRAPYQDLDTINL